MHKVDTIPHQERIIVLHDGRRRIGIPACDAREIDDGEISMYLHLAEDAEQGLDEWRYLTGLDIIVHGSIPYGPEGNIVLEYGRTAEWSVPPMFLVYLSEKAYVAQYGEYSDEQYTRDFLYEREQDDA